MTRLAATALVALGLTLAAAGPALAYPNCLTGGGVSVEIGIGDFSEQDRMEFDLLQARRHGIDAETAERTWLDCVKITRIEDGRWITEYYDPRTWELVQ